MGTSSHMPNISIRNAEAVISPMFIGAASVFMDISNDGNEEDVLTTVKTSMPKVATMMHDIQDGRMVMTDRISIPPGGVTLRPGGLHIMLFNMPKTLKEGDKFTLYLTFARSGLKQVEVRVVSGHNGGHASTR